jgi:1-deoxy-D-xylulose-5-phosphate reductoisomerase
MRNVVILGSTGSIGRSALAVVEAHPAELRVVGLAAGTNSARFLEQVERFRPQSVAMASASATGTVLDAVAGRRLDGVEVVGEGPAGLQAVATHPDADIVLCASSGTAALEAVLAAIEAGKTIALANKEILVMAGGIMMEAARRRGVPILPVDSEHNAIHQCLHGRDASEIRRLILTASGGPFRDRSRTDLEAMTAQDALQHPTWKMGRKITIDSATLMNKGLEVIEARWLFDVSPDRVDVVIHPQSIVHSMVELRDGSVIAQLGVTDMRLPIQYAFSYPERWDGALDSLDLAAHGRLDFEPPDRERFPCLGLAYRALEGDASLPVALNAANEVAVASFLDGDLRFTGIARLIEQVMDRSEASCRVDTLAEVREVDRWARETAGELLGGLR